MLFVIAACGFVFQLTKSCLSASQENFQYEQSKYGRISQTKLSIQYLPIALGNLLCEKHRDFAGDKTKTYKQPTISGKSISDTKSVLVVVDIRKLY